MSLMAWLLIGWLPPDPRILSSTPCQNSRPARVTTNEGRPMRVMIVPCSRPMPAQISSATATASGHGQSCEGLIRVAMNAA